MGCLWVLVGGVVGWCFLWGGLVLDLFLFDVFWGIGWFAVGFGVVLVCFGVMVLLPGGLRCCFWFLI